MPIEQMILEAVHNLPTEKQQEVLEFARFLAVKNGQKRPLRSLMGLCADLNVNVSAEDIDEARREMWGNFPREDI
jgi:hypothetical protein